MVKHKILEKESDGKVRAFMFVERFHLTRLWSYKAIKEEIKIYHKILVRLNEKVLSSDFIKNLESFLGTNESPKSKDDDEEQLLEKEEAQKQKDFFDEKLTPLIDRITLEGLKDDQPIIPLNIIEGELKRSLAEEFGDDDKAL